MTRKFVKDALLKMGVPAGNMGFNCIIEVIMYMQENGSQYIKFDAAYWTIQNRNPNFDCAMERVIRYALKDLRKHQEKRDIIEHYVGFSHAGIKDSLSKFYIVLNEEYEESMEKEGAMV